ncbi:MAG: hypothetical protein ABL933_02080 [Methyloglobulus sp.]
MKSYSAITYTLIFVDVLLHNAVIDNPSNLLGVVLWVFGRAPDTCPAKLTAPAFFIVMGTIHLTPGVGPALNYPPSIARRIVQSRRDLFILMGHYLSL